MVRNSSYIYPVISTLRDVGAPGVPAPGPRAGQGGAGGGGGGQSGGGGGGGRGGHGAPQHRAHARHPCNTRQVSGLQLSSLLYLASILSIIDFYTNPNEVYNYVALVDYLLCVQAARARRGRAVASLDLLPLQRADLAAPSRPLHPRTRQVQIRPRYIYISTYLHIYKLATAPSPSLRRCCWGWTPGWGCCSPPRPPWCSRWARTPPWWWRPSDRTRGPARSTRATGGWWL